MMLHAASRDTASLAPPRDVAALDHAAAARLGAFLSDSALVDREGRPIVFYRGESGGELFTVFDLRRTRESGFFFTTNVAVASSYANGGERYLPGEMPDTDSDAFREEGSVGLLPEIPEDERAPAYPPPPGSPAAEAGG